MRGKSIIDGFSKHVTQAHKQLAGKQIKNPQPIMADRSVINRKMGIGVDSLSTRFSGSFEEKGDSLSLITELVNHTEALGAVLFGEHTAQPRISSTVTLKTSLSFKSFLAVSSRLPPSYWLYADWDTPIILATSTCFRPAASRNCLSLFGYFMHLRSSRSSEL